MIQTNKTVMKNQNRIIGIQDCQFQDLHIQEESFQRMKTTKKQQQLLKVLWHKLSRHPWKKHFRLMMPIIQAINDEINALEENKTWELVYRDKDMHVISNRWVFRNKYKSNGDVEKYKARLVAKGYSQIPGIDYEKTFAPVVKFDSIRTLLAISAAKILKLYQFDVKTAFLHGNIEETIYMEQPYGFAKNNRVCKLNRSLYGLKQAPRQWNKRIAEFLENYAQSRLRCLFCSVHE